MKYKARILSLIFFFSTITLILNAQERKGREQHIEKFRSMKIAFITDRIELSPEEAEKFWPLYNENEKKKQELSGYRKMRSRNFSQQMENLSDEEVEEMIDNIIETRKKEAQLSAEFHEDLKNILPPKKIMKLYITEIQFREYMLRRIRDERRGSPHEKGENPPPGSLLP
ncbi:MAG: hypothetical protein KAT31_02090 [Bacteroidales bacterium]|nr:hypothetical protein [Bacteroidales bacterium]